MSSIMKFLTVDVSLLKVGRLVVGIEADGRSEFKSRDARDSRMSFPRSFSLLAKKLGSLLLLVVLILLMGGVVDWRLIISLPLVFCFVPSCCV